MKVLTAAQMRVVDRRTTELGIPDIVLMENAGHRVVELIAEKFAPLARQRVVVFCGKGNNGGDGFVVARQLLTRFRPRSLEVVFAGEAESLKGSAAQNYRMAVACGCPITDTTTPEIRRATLVVDALLGTGLTGPARGRMLELIREINTGFPEARVVAVDIPSGLPSDTGTLLGELYEDDDSIFLSLNGPDEFRRLFAPRPKGAHKGSFGHVLVIGGGRGKTGAAAMAGISALRAGAGLVTVASASSAIPVIAGHAAELMTEPLPETAGGSISPAAFETGRIQRVAENKTVLGLGPGIGTDAETVQFARQAVATFRQPMVVDADGLNAIAGTEFPGRPSLILTPHPGEMARLTGLSRDEILADRVGTARSFATEHNVVLVLKGQRSLIAMPDGRVWINPTGTPAMATGGSGDILTGLIAGLVAQFPDQLERAVLAAVWLHGRAGELGAGDLGEQALVATDLLAYLPEAIEECGRVPDKV